MNKKALWLTSVPLAVIALCVTLGGCEQGIGGGVKSDVTVTLRSAELQIEETGPGDSDTATNEPGSTDPSTGSGPGTFTGRVVFDGTPPSFPLLIAKGADVKDKQFCSADDLPNEKLVVDAAGGVANVFIFLDEAPKGYKPGDQALEQYHFDQKFCRFLPHAFVVQTGQEVRITNSDGQAPEAFHLGQYALANILYYPVTNWMLGPEVQWGQRENVNDFTFNQYRIQFSVRWNFSLSIRG